jgi:hypothetical protein
MAQGLKFLEGKMHFFHLGSSVHEYQADMFWMWIIALNGAYSRLNCIDPCVNRMGGLKIIELIMGDLEVLNGAYSRLNCIDPCVHMNTKQT